nr:sortase [Leifsonia shinshuensis]
MPVRPRRPSGPVRGPRPPRRRPAGATPPPRPPKPPRRPPAPPRPPLVLSPREQLVRGIVALLAVALLGVAANVLVLSHIHHLVGQQIALNEFRQELSDATAPVGEGDVNGVILADGSPVARLTIPSIGVDEVVLEGSSSGVTMNGPGHRRDTVLPGQAGQSVVLGRAAAYGGPFSRIQELLPGATITAITGQGKSTYTVIGVRYAGDPTLPALQGSQGRLTLVTARGVPYVPAGVVRVDAQLVSTPKPAGARATAPLSLPLADRELAGDPSTVWLLVFALQAIVVAEILAVRSLSRFGLRKTWIVFAPVLLAGGVIAADQISRLLPNLL